MNIRCILVSALAFGLSSYACAQEVTFRDVRSLLHNATGYPTGIIASETCSNKSGCTKYCAKRPNCNRFYEIWNINLQDIRAVDYQLPDPNQLPVRRDEKLISAANCFKEEEITRRLDLRKTTTETASLTQREIFRNVAEFSTKFSVDAKFFDDIGIRLGEDITNTFTYELAKASEFDQSRVESLEETIDLRVPPMTERFIFYSDGIKSAEIPITVDAIFDADIYIVERAQPGNVEWAKVPVGKVSGTVPEEQRLFKSTGSIFFQGSDETLSSRYIERPIENGDPQCQTGGFILQKESSFKPSNQKIRSESSEALMNSEVDSNGDCTFESTASVIRFDQNGSEAAALFNIDVGLPRCSRSSGSLNFRTYAVSDEDYASVSAYESKDAYAVWSNEAGETFRLEWSDPNHLADGERLVDISDLSVQDCFCRAFSDQTHR